MAKYKTRVIKSITEYVEYIGKNVKLDNVLFRGQREDKPLLPKIARINLRDPILDAEKKMIRDFKRRVLPYLPTIPSTDWDWLSIAQHHGMATRLLDWTLNPMAALWFAVRKPPLNEEGKLKCGVIWIFVPKESDYVTATLKSPFRINRTMVFRPKHIAPRLVSQSGWFTAHKFIEIENKFIPLEANKSYSAKLTKLNIPPESFSDMRSELDRFNVNSSTQFPDIDGLCQHIEWLNSNLKDEQEGSKMPLYDDVNVSRKV